jgi:type III secretion protein J
VRGAIGGALLVVSAGGCDVALIRGLSREQANDALAALDRNGVVGRAVPDDRASSRMRIDVNDSAVADAVAALEAERTRAQCAAGAPAPASRWIETPGEERERHAARLEQQLERSLSRLPGVAEAHVHLSLPTGPSSLPEAQTPAAASLLLVRTASGAPVAAAAKELVAGATAGLAPSDVRVVETVQKATAAREARFARVGPVVVNQESLGALRLWIAVSLLVHIALAAALLRPLLRRRAKAKSSVAPES